MSRRGRLIAAMAGAWIAPAAVAQPALPYRSLTGAFAQFAESTAGQPILARVAAFKQRFGGLFPAFYRPRDGRTPAAYDRMIAQALLRYPQQRAAMVQVEAGFGDAFRTGLARFRTSFPGFRLTSPVYVLHSLGEMDAGTRVIGKRRVLIFGVDGIAHSDTPDSVPVMLDHEFFHMVHTRTFPGCYALWCTLWREGLAVYAASTMTPGATDAQLGLEEPVPLRPAVDRGERAAWCLLRARFGTTDRDSQRLFFRAGGGTGALPPRFGYYLGYRIAQRAGQTRTLAALTALTMRPAQVLVRETLETMAREAGGCDLPMQVAQN